MRDGLSFNSVMSLLEDTRGFLWVGTREGLNRYDGYGFKTYTHSPYDTLSLSNSHINVIFETSTRRLWIGTARGLNRYDPTTQGFVSYVASGDSSGLTNNYIKSIIEHTDGTLWVGTANGVTILDRDGNVVEQVYLSTPHSDANNTITLYRDTGGLVWLGTKGGLYIREGGWFRRVVVDPNAEKGGMPFEIRDIRQDEKGTYWIATEQHGIYAFRYAGGVYRHEHHYHTGNAGILSNQVRKLLADGDKLWLATLSGLSILDRPTQAFTNIRYSIQYPDGISRGSIHDVLKDRFGGYWVATYSGGLNYHHPEHQLFDHFKRMAGVDDGLNENDVNGFVENPSGEIWISTGRGISHFNPMTRRFRHVGADGSGGLSHRIVKTMVADPEGNLWIGTYHGLNRYDAATGRIRHYFHEQGTNSLNQDQVHALYLDRDGLLWIGMNTGEFQVYDPASGRFEDVPGVGNIVSYIYEDRNERLWVGTRSGLKCLDRRTRELVDISGILGGAADQLLFVNWITEDSQGRLWVGTQGSGLFLIESGRMHWFGQGQGLSGNTVNAMLEDSNGDFWLSTNAGLSRLVYGTDHSGSPRLHATDFYEINGLQGAQFNPGSALRTRAGRLYFGGINGFNSFQPEAVRKTTYFPDVRFIGLAIHAGDTSATKAGFGDLSRRGDSVITLGYDQRNLTIGFSGINFVDADATVYRYMLNNLEHGWVDIGKQRTINFTYLPIGTHEIRLQASSDGVTWGDTFATLRIRVRPPWYLTTIAYAVYLLCLMLLAYGVILFFHRRAKLKNQRYVEKLMREKEQRMLASKLTFFTDISHELRTPLTLILTPLERLMSAQGLSEHLTEQLTMIRRNGRKMMEMINQVLNLRRIETEQHIRLEAARDDLVIFLKETVYMFRPLATARQLGFSYAFEPDRLETGFDASKLEMVLYNLLSNAFKFTEADGSVRLEMGYCPETELPDGAPRGGQYVVIRVKNTGKPIAADIMDRLFDRYYTVDNAIGDNPDGAGIGLDLSLRMVQLHGGYLAVSRDGQWNCFSVILPLITATEGRAQPVAEEPHAYELPALTPDEAVPRGARGEQQRLLVVEDNADVRALVRSLLDTHYRILEAPDGQQGLKLALEHIPDLVISDIMMPVMDGIELCRKLKTDMRTSHIPVVLLTARATFPHKYEGYETGADAYITKPFSPNYLLVRIANLLRHRLAVRDRLQRDALLEPGEVAVNSVDDQLLKKAKAFVEEHMADSGFTIEAMCREIGLSRMHFHRKMKALTGLSPAGFVRLIRLRRAAAILGHEAVSVKEAMALVGFDNADHFRKSFREEFGVLPSEYPKTKGADIGE